MAEATFPQITVRSDYVGKRDKNKRETPEKEEVQCFKL